MKWYACIALLMLGGCGAQGASPPPAAGSVVLGWQSQYLGFGTDACTSGCVRAPGYNAAIPVSQSGNGATFSVTSSDPSIAGGVITNTGMPGQNDVSLVVGPHKAGTATLTVTGIGGASAQLAVTVTTISTMTVNLNGYPSATTLSFTVNAPASANCPSFEGGYSFDWGAPLAPATQVVLHNFPAMGTGPLSGCLFSNVTVTVRDSNYAVLATKTVSLPITLAQDNPSTITIP